jgi:hypothetical protein
MFSDNDNLNHVQNMMNSKEIQQEGERLIKMKNNIKRQMSADQMALLIINQNNIIKEQSGQMVDLINITNNIQEHVHQEKDIKKTNNQDSSIYEYMKIICVLLTILILLIIYLKM